MSIKKGKKQVYKVCKYCGCNTGKHYGWCRLYSPFKPKKSKFSKKALLVAYKKAIKKHTPKKSIKKKAINFGNPLRNLAGNCYVAKKPTSKEILEQILDGMSDFTGTCWNPVEEVKDGKATAYSLMLNQCPGACGHVWKITIRDSNVSNWLVNEINERRWGANGKHKKLLPKITNP